MGIGVGLLTESYAYDLNAAAYSFNSKDLTSKKQYASKIYGIYFHFSTRQSKTITITLERVSNAVTYTLQVFTIELPNEQDYVWHNFLELPEVVDLRIDVTKTSGACLLNMMAVYK